LNVIDLSLFVKKLSDLGERQAIRLISKILSEGDVAVGIGDDCAALDFGDEYLLVSTDMITEKTHIPDVMTPWQIGWFIIAINLSDIAAKGGQPLGLVLSLGLPKNTTESFLKELMKGANDCATKYGTTIIGGDTKENSQITICGTAFGTVRKDEFMSRKGAKPGDIVAVTGTLGKAGAGYFALQHNLKGKILKDILEPQPKIKEGRTLAKQKTVTSCMDISDGLSSSLYQLQELNKVGFEIKKDCIPLSPSLFDLAEKHTEIDVHEYALHFGGEYELLLTIPPDAFEQAREKLTAIGTVTKEQDIALIDGASKTILKNKGYEHFKDSDFFNL